MRRYAKVLPIICIASLVSGCVPTAQVNEKKNNSIEKLNLESTLGEDAQYFYIGGIYYEDYIETLRAYLDTMYNAKNEEQYTTTIKNITSLMTKPCAAGFNQLTSAYKENKYATIVSDVKYGLSKWESSNNTQILFEITTVVDEKKQKYYLEFGCDQEGKINHFDIW